MKHQRTTRGDNSEVNRQEVGPGTASALSVSLAETNAGTLSVILRTLETMQATISAMQNTMQKEVAEIKQTQFSIISSQRHLSNQVLDLQNHKKRFFTRLQDMPLEVIIQIFASIPAPILNMRTGIEVYWFHLPESYQKVVASAMPGEIKRVQRHFETHAEKKLPESILCLTVVNEIKLNCSKLIGNIPDGIGALWNLTRLELINNSLTGPLPSSLNQLVALQILILSDNQLSGEFPALPNLCALSTLYLKRNRFTGPIPTVFGNPRNLTSLHVEENCFSVIPTTISQLTGLEYLIISQNPLACEIPPEIWNLTHLRTLDMSGCKMFGSLAGVGALHNLRNLDVSNNQFSGELPSREIHGLENLVRLHLIENQFSGGEILDMRGTRLWAMCVDPDFGRKYVIWGDQRLCNEHKFLPDVGGNQESDSV
ncbi:hypothetical protein CcCBS67573_g05931 [Chytriomyces confervae]|uniref:F-box domain-containing protein n=1 Tax=Chytriomyces confervae TaxID=246404 RepID=A0A507F8Y4_9FUNG|nr:hypothetical protein CcCBS67573_g05931 [Chytriomyces confervae]